MFIKALDLVSNNDFLQEKKKIKNVKRHFEYLNLEVSSMYNEIQDYLVYAKNKSDSLS
jgi:hypothetical protein